MYGLTCTFGPSNLTPFWLGQYFESEERLTMPLGEYLDRRKQENLYWAQARGWGSVALSLQTQRHRIF